MVRGYFYCVSPIPTIILVGFLSFDIKVSMDQHNDWVNYSVLENCGFNYHTLARITYF